MEEAEVIRGELAKVIHEIKKSIIDHISRLEGHFNTAVLDLRLAVEDLIKKNYFCKRGVMTLKTKLNILKKSNLCSPNR